MQKNLTEQQLIISARGPKKARVIIDNNLPDHYHQTLKKFESGKTIMWNWAAFFAGNLWFIHKNMPLVYSVSYVVFFCLAAIFGNFLFAWIILSFAIGCFGEKLFVKHLLKKIQQNNFDDLSEDVKSDFIAKVGMSEQQYLSCIYGEDNANTLMHYNAPNHYRQAFTKFACGQRLVWNWTAGWLNAYWLIYRKLPHYALIIALLMMWPHSYLLQGVVSGAKNLYTNPQAIETMSILLVALSGLGLLLIISLSLFGDRLVFNYISKQIQQNNYAFFAKEGGKTGLVWTVFLCGILLTLTYQAIYYINGWETWIIHREIIALIPFIAAFIHTQYEIKTYAKTRKH